MKWPTLKYLLDRREIGNPINESMIVHAFDLRSQMFYFELFNRFEFYNTVMVDRMARRVGERIPNRISIITIDIEDQNDASVEQNTAF